MNHCKNVYVSIETKDDKINIAKLSVCYGQKSLEEVSNVSILDIVNNFNNERTHGTRNAHNYLVEKLFVVLDLIMIFTD